MTEMLLQTFANEYLPPLYYFCLRKTGSAEEAEELAADVSRRVVMQRDAGQFLRSFRHGYGRLRAIVTADG